MALSYISKKSEQSWLNRLIFIIIVRYTKILFRLNIALCDVCKVFLDNWLASANAHLTNARLQNTQVQELLKNSFAWANIEEEGPSLIVFFVCHLEQDIATFAMT